MLLLRVGGEATLLIDIAVGLATGAIGSLFYYYDGERYCLSSIFMGTLYWFFYGTAFVVGLVEILAGELETGVTRFMAVSIKTFVLCVTACFGMLLAIPNPAEVWEAQAVNCGTIDLGEHWWRVSPILGMFCGCPGTVPFPLGAILARFVGAACRLWSPVSGISLFVATQFHCQGQFGRHGFQCVWCSSQCCDCMLLVGGDGFCELHLLQAAPPAWCTSWWDRLQAGWYFVWFHFHCGEVLFTHWGLVDNMIKTWWSWRRKSINNPKSWMIQNILVQKSNWKDMKKICCWIPLSMPNLWIFGLCWCPAVYQLVPGSMIAKMWFQTIIPPSDPAQEENTFAGLMVTSISLALGLIVGEAIVQTCTGMFNMCCKSKKSGEEESKDLGSDLAMLGESPITVAFEEEDDGSVMALWDLWGPGVQLTSDSSDLMLSVPVFFFARRYN